MNQKFIIGLFVIAGFFSSSASAWTVDSERDYYDAQNTLLNENEDYLLSTEYGTGWENFNQGIFIKFDLTTITDSSVTQAFLNLENIEQPNTISGSMHISVFNMGIDVGTAGSNDAVYQTIGSAIDTVYIDNYGQYQWDITSLVNGWLDGSITNNGIGLYATPVDNSFETIRFASSRNNDYTGPSITAVPEPSVLGLMLGGLGLVGMVAYRTRKVQA